MRDTSRPAGPAGTRPSGPAGVRPGRRTIERCAICQVPFGRVTKHEPWCDMYEEPE